ncbi:uncharacterized protein [Epargyreus clarus]|uniref:uncharacterized protein n=1 Tax=Epargyreus clarus TaxID=520877 RepID=UPI003C2B485A
MRCTWLALLLVSCALVAAEAEAEAGGQEPGPVATTRAPPRTLDRKAAELAWRSWLQSPESGNQNAPPRRITTKSLFITPLVCPKGQRLDRNACVQVVTVNKDEHERILLEQLNALFTSAPSNGDVLYDYGDDEPGPLQLSIPIGLDPQAASLQQEPSAQAQNFQASYVKVDKKGDSVPGASSIEAELELLKLQQAHSTLNDTASSILSHNVMNNLLAHSDKPKRDSPMVNASDVDSLNATDEGQKEKVYGHVSVDPVLYDEENSDVPAVNDNVKISNETLHDNNTTSANNSHSSPEANSTNILSKTASDESTKLTAALSNSKDGDESKLNPENDYSDIGEAIKLISRYAEVSTDDNFAKDKKKAPEDGILGTRTKLQYRRKPKPMESIKESVPAQLLSDIVATDEKISNIDSKNNVYYRYPWTSEHPAAPPPEYPFRHLQDYWSGRNPVGGLYGPMHENPRRHHHSYPHYFRPRSYSNAGSPNTYPALQEAYQRYLHRVAQRDASPIRTRGNNQDLYSLLGLRHWFSNEDVSKR